MKIIYYTLISLALMSTNSFADDYVIDKKGMHASIEFKISHLGYSWLRGRFNDFDGDFNYDGKNPDASKINVTINTASIDSNHAERDKHLRSDEFLDVKKYPKATFKSTSFKQKKDGSAILKGNFTLHGVTKPITINTHYINQGKDPWGGYRIGFEGTSKIALADYGILKNLGPASKELDLIFSIEGVRK